MAFTGSFAANEPFTCTLAGFHLDEYFAGVIHQCFTANHGAALPSSLAVALSGGADSMALTLLAQRWATAHNVSLIALTVDHRLRPESSTEALQVAQWMHQHNITHHILTPDHISAPHNIQAAARQWRYDALSEYCRTHGIAHCLVAHTAGDNRETVEHALARGDTADGASGMAHVRMHRGVCFLRPLLEVERDTLETFLRRAGAHWVEDPSNRNMLFARVRNRQKLHTNPARVHELNGILADARRERTAREMRVSQAASKLVDIHPLGYATLDLSGWLALDTPIADQLIADILRCIDGGPYRPRGAEVLRLTDALRRGDIFRRTLHRCELSTKSGTLTIARELSRVAAPLALQETGIICWDKRFDLHYTLPHDMSLTLRALGHDGRKASPRYAALPLASPSLWHLDKCVAVPHMDTRALSGVHIALAFSPAKALDAAPFW